MIPDQNELIDANFKHGLLRIVYINSAHHGYSELPLDGNLALFGNNNKGKTASLAGLKLLLYPENSFTKCESKFQFEGKDGAYDKESSYPFYFPSNESYILMEAENKHGNFCMLLYRNSEQWGYGRFFIPCDYATLRPLFWCEDANEGNGHFADTLSLKALSPYLKKHGAIQTADSKEIADRIYDGYNNTAAAGRYCTIPLRDGASKEAIETFKHLYQLSFDISSANSKTLPKAIATLIEMNRSRKNERLDTDISALMEEHNLLSTISDELQRTDNHLGAWQKIEGYAQNVGELSTTLGDQLALLSGSYQRQKDTLSTRLSDALTRKTKEQGQEDTLKRAHAPIKKEHQQAQGRLSVLSKQLVNSEKNLLKATSLKGQYPGYTLMQILEALDEDLAEKTQLLSDVQTAEGVGRRLQQEHVALGKAERSLAQVERALSTLDNSLLNALSPHAASILMLCSDEFNAMSLPIKPKGILANDLQYIEDFANLFSVSAPDEIRFLDNVFNGEIATFNSEAQLIALKTQKAQLEDQIICLSASIKEIDELLQNQAKLKDKPEALEREVKTIERERMLIMAFEQTREQVAILKDDVTKQTSECQTLEASASLAKNRWQKQYALMSDAVKCFNLVAEEGNVLSRWETRFRHIELRHNGLLSTTHLPLLQRPVDDSDLDELDRLEATYTELWRTFQKNTDTLRIGVPLSIDESFKQLNVFADYQTILAAYTQLYLDLPHKKTLHEKEISTHNQFIENQMKELEDAQTTLSHFVQELNHDINKHQISDLAEIRLKLSLDARFVNLMKSIQRYDISQNKLLSVDFYQELAAFAKSFFDKKQRTLQLSMIIEKIGYEFRHLDQEHFETKSQSGGTSSAISALVLSVLLKRIVPNYTSVKIPIVIDEIGTLDGCNKKTTIDQIAANGFSVFCATPSLQSDVVQNIGNYLDLDRFTVDTPIVDGCHTLILENFLEGLNARTSTPMDEATHEN
jgi:hypothetical protein